MGPELESIALSVHRETGLDDPPVDAFELAALCGMTLRPARNGRGFASDSVIAYPARSRRVRQHGVIAHELGHWALRWAGEDDSEQGADYLAGALLLPRRCLDTDLKNSWDFSLLRARHVNVSAEMLARRITQVRDAVATIIDHGQVKSRVTSPWINGRQWKRMSRWERNLADQALETEETVYGDELCYAVPVIEGTWRRVVVVCEAEQLSLRL